MHAPPGILDAADHDRKDLPCTVLKDDDLGDSVSFNDSEEASPWGTRESHQYDQDACTFGHTIGKGGKMDAAWSVTSSGGSELLRNRTTVDEPK